MEELTFMEVLKIFEVIALWMIVLMLFLHD